jgi:NAD(P)-dependent dehydrogenase (short-subunit alcohol dehydrogenase family)
LTTDLSFDGKVAIVTGAGGGLGRQHAMLLASRGARVVVNDIGSTLTGEGSDAGRAQSVVSEIRDLGGEAIGETSSVGTADGGQALVQSALDTYGRVDILVNNAGIMHDAPFEGMTPDLVDPLIDVHLRGAFHVSRPAWIAMQRQGYGRIVNTTSAAGLLSGSHKSNYAAAKSGIIGFTKSLSFEGAPHDIKVNAIAPMAMTRMTAQAVADANDVDEFAPGALDQLKTFVDMLDPGLVSPVVAFLAHEQCPVSGEVFTVGGGQVSRFFIGRTVGHFNPRLSVEDVRDNFDKIRDLEKFTVPKGSGDEVAQLFESISKTTPVFGS